MVICGLKNRKPFVYSDLGWSWGSNLVKDLPGSQFMKYHIHWKAQKKQGFSGSDITLCYERLWSYITSLVIFEIPKEWGAKIKKKKRNLNP